VDALLSHGARIDVKNQLQKSPEMLARENGHMEVVARLKQASEVEWAIAVRKEAEAKAVAEVCVDAARGAVGASPR
jgi:hypothetical protein